MTVTSSIPASMLTMSLALVTVTSSISTSHLSPGGWVCGEETYPSSWICDGYKQCDDDSDEGREPHQGCNLFPGSGCDSFGGRRHFRCWRTGKCFSEQSEAELCEADLVSQGPVRECRHDDSGGRGWRCDDGRCVLAAQVGSVNSVNSVHRCTGVQVMTAAMCWLPCWGVQAYSTGLKYRCAGVH